MKVAAPHLLPLLRSRSQGEIIAHLMLDPDREHTASEIATHLGVSLPTVQREVSRLADAGLVTSRKKGNLRLLRVQTDNPVFRPLAELMAVTFGPLPVLREALAGVPGVEQAFIYGSWAARYEGQAGSVPGDVDLMVIGDVDRSRLDEAVDAAERVLRREVNTRRLTRQAWEDDQGSFRSTVTRRPMVAVVPASTGGE